VLALTAALVGPYFIDWTGYRADFEREASRILGREVKVEGSASARLLPFPSLTFTDVTVAGIEPGEPAVTVETFSMDAELAPFMRGDLLIFDMRLVRPTIIVDIAEDGGLDWAVRPSVPVGASHIALEKLTITEGKVALRHAASGRIHQLTEINADISARALTGPWRIDGSLRIDGMRTAVQVSTGSLDEGGMRLRVQARPERYPVALEADGQARIVDGRTRYGGQFKLNATALAERRPGQPEAQGKPAPPAYRLAGNFDIDHAAVRIDQFRFETGSAEDPYTAEGSASFDLGREPSFAIRADGAQIRFGGEDEGSGGIGFEARMAALRDFLLDMPRPSIPGRIEVALPAIVAGDTTVRDVRLSTRPSGTGWTIDSLSATLPGRATLEADGELAVGQEDLGFEGNLLLAIAQPSGFAAWLSKDVDDAIRRLPAAGFNAVVSLGRERQSLRDLELVLGGARFRGEVDSRTPEGQRPSMLLRLDGDRLDVEGMMAFASLFVSEGGETRLADRDLEFDITAGPVTVAGLTAETLDTALRLKDGRLDIDRLSVGGLSGANISATGMVRDFGTAPVGNIDAAIIAPDLAPLAATIAAQFPDSRLAAEIVRRARLYPGLFEDSTIQLIASSAAAGDGTSGLAVTATGETGGTNFALTLSSPRASLALDRVALEMGLTARTDEAGALYALLGLPALPLGLAGGVETELTFDGVIASGGQTRFSFAGDGLDFQFEGEAGLEAGALSANGNLMLEADDLDPWLATGGVALPGMGLGLPARATAQLDISGGMLVLSGLDGEVAGSTVRGDVNAQIRDGLPHLTGELALQSFDLSPAAEMVVGAAALAGDGEAWPTTPFAGAGSSLVSTELEIAADRLQAGMFGEALDARFTLRLGPRGVALSDVGARYRGGTLTGLAELRNEGGTGFLSGQFKLDDAPLRDVFGDVGLDARADLTASLTSSGKSVDGLISALAGSGTVSVRDLVISGVDPDALGDILREADRLGPDIDAAATSVFAPDLIRRGAFRVAGADLAFTVANGTVRAPPLVLETPQATLRTELRADLGDSAVQADAMLVYQPGVEALVGSEPAVRLVAAGPTDDIGVLVDTEPLAQFLTQRALELEQQRVEAMQAALLEKQRHRREVRYYAALDEGRRNAAHEAERLRRELELQLEEEARRAAEETARQADEQRAAQEAERQRAAEEAERHRAEQDSQRAAEEEARQRDRREADEKLRRSVEELLRSRERSEAPLASPDAVARQPLPPPMMQPTPTPAPRGAASSGVAPTPRASDVFSERNLTIEGLMRAIGE